jgi:hypothetical protein
VTNEIDTGRMAEVMTKLAEVHGTHSVAIVLPLRPGMRDVAAEFLAEGPPFDPRALGLARHQVFLTDAEVVFLFETEQGLSTLDEMLADPDFWTVARSWEHLMADQPRIGGAIFEWPARRKNQPL